jgi:two-component sensor histidine kinase
MQISGPVISNLALLLHELATNSVKYGALSAPVGRIRIQCAARSETAVIIWTELGGPPVTSPNGNHGFGELLVRATVTGRLGGEISREWKPEGLVIRLSVARERLIG